MKWLSVVLVTMLLTVSAWAQDAVKIGVVDLQRALNESKAGARARELFKVEVDKAQAALKKKKDEVDRLRTQFEKKAVVLKGEERRNMEKDLVRMGRDFERAYKDSQDELQAKDTELTADILRDLQGVIQEYGEKHGYTLVVERSSTAVLYGSNAADVTDEIIKIYDKRGSGGKRR